jgi:hypothetical protein
MLLIFNLNFEEPPARGCEAKAGSAVAADA